MDRSTIVAELKLGNEEALRAIYDQYNTLLVSFARYTIRNPLLAEDFVQDAFCSLWENRENWIMSYRFKATFTESYIVAVSSPENRIYITNLTYTVCQLLK